MRIRPFQDADEDAVPALWKACGLTRPWNDPRRDIAPPGYRQHDVVSPGRRLIPDGTGNGSTSE